MAMLTDPEPGSSRNQREINSAAFHNMTLTAQGESAFGSIHYHHESIEWC